jgi:MFS transporter, ACS family, allantoate permease
MQRFPPAKHIATCMTLWGVVLACMAACNNYAGLMVQRCALGSLEAAVNCGFMLVTGQWYRQFEQATKVGVWSAMVGIASIVGGAIAYGCAAGFEAHPNMTFTSWKILALCTGLFSTVYGMAMYYFLPGSCVTARWLNHEEKVLAIERLRGNHSGVGTKVYKRYQAIEAARDYRVSPLLIDLNETNE